MRMNGRWWLLITPLLRNAHGDYPSYMDSFKYALSGEFAFQQARHTNVI